MPRPISDAHQALGHTVRDRRLALELTQVGLADIAGLSANYLSDIENGRRNVTFSALVKLARALDLTLAQLVADVQVDARKQSRGPKGR